MSNDRPDEPPALSPREAWERYLNNKRMEIRESSLTSIRNRLKLFIEWCEGQGFETIDELGGWDFDEYENYRAGMIAPITLEKEMGSLRNFFEYLERIEVVEGGTAERIHVPVADEEERTNETRLAEPDAFDLIEHYRSNSAARATRKHVLLELEWFVGARMGGLRALDVRDVHVDEEFLEFHHRPSTGTNLKNGAGHHPRGGERYVGLPASVAEVLDEYLRQGRHDVQDDHGRAPFLSTSVGRPGTTTIRNATYQATLPCQHGPCPHGKDPESCEWTIQNKASQCPSSRSPHHVRTGSIIFQRDAGLPATVVAERVNASIATIEEYYDHQTSRQRLERRRRQFVDQLEFQT